MKEGWEHIICPICRTTIHSHYAAPIVSRSRVSSRDPQAGSAMLTQMMLAANETHEEMVRNAEDACVKHYVDSHPRRYRLWKRLKWAWLMKRRWPWSRVTGQIFDFSERANA